eukprot:6314365-Karenia_brevis.AAC.1
MVVHHRASGQREDEQRVRDLCHPECSHDWLWPRDAAAGPVMSHADYVTAVRLRLGCAGDEPAVCGCCGQALLHTHAGHALCCAKGPSTRGHNAVRDA